MQEGTIALRITDKNVGNSLRGLAAIGVMLGHLTFMLPWYIHRLFPGELFVGLFFFFSGYGLYVSLRRENYLDGFIKKKVAKIYLPFLLAEAFYTLLILTTQQEFTFKSFVLGSLGIQLYNKVLWYVIELLIINILFYVISKYLPRLSKRGILFTWIGIYVAFVLVGVAINIDTCWYLSTSAFLIGVVVALFQSFVQRILINGTGFVICLLFVLGYCGLCYIINTKDALSYIPINYLITIVEMLLVPLFVLSIIFLAQRFGVTFGSNSIMNPLGIFSYEIYLWHIPIFYILKGCFSNDYVTIILTVLLTIGVSSLIKYKQLKTAIHVGNH